MRGTGSGMSATLLAAQKSIGVGNLANKPYCQIVLTRSGQTTRTYTTEDRLIRVRHVEEDDNIIAEVLLDNSDGALTSIDFEQYQGVIPYGYTTSAGNEVSPCAPLKVIGQQFYSAPGYLLCNLYLIGIPNQLRRDKAIAEYTQESTDTNTVKTLISAVCAASTGLSSAYNDYTAITVVYDSEDSLIDTFKPADYFSISINESRWDKIEELLNYTGCKWRFENDGKLHIFVPKITVTNIDVGSAATDRNVTSVAGYTQIDLANPALASGKITSVEVWANTTLAGFRVGTFYLVSGTTYRCRDSAIIGTVTAGSKQTITQDSSGNALAITVVAGDFIGCYYTGGTLETSNSGGSGRAYTIGEKIDPGDQATDYYTDAGYSISLYATGTDYDYEYRFLVDTYHTFFNKTIRNRFVDPNKEIVNSHPGHIPAYTGSATSATSFALAQKIHTTYRRLVSDAEAALIAAAIIEQNELDAESGSAIVPMNCGQEIWDYVKFTDAREGGDTKVGNVQYIERNVDVTKSMGKGGYDMTLRFGRASQQSQFGLDSLTVGGGVNPEILNRINRLTDDILDLYQNQYTMLTDGFRIDQTLVYGAGYDPTDKRRVFTATPTTPYVVGDLWLEAGIIKRCTTARASGSYTAGDWTTVKLDDVAEGTTYSRVLTTSISAGKILLSQAEGTLDNIANGTYGKVLTTDISAGHILLSSVVQSASYRTASDTEKGVWNGKPDDMDEIPNGVTYLKTLATQIDAGRISLTAANYYSGKFSGEWYSGGASGVDIDATHGINIYGVANALTTRATKTGTIQCYVGADGKIYAGAGAVVLDASGIKIKGQLLYLQHTDGVDKGYLYGGTTRLMLTASNAPLYLAPGTGYNIEIDGGNVVPVTTDTRNLGSSDYRFKGIYGRPVLDRIGEVIEGGFKHRDLGGGWLSTYSNGAWRDNG